MLLAAVPAARLAVRAADPDWPTVQMIEHRVFQAVNPDGSSAYTNGFPARLTGILLNNPEDWLDPTPNYTPQYVPWFLGGEWEIFVQAVALPDFGGTACWMGQNYGNLPWLGDPFYSYTDEEWLAEMQRINYPEGPGSDPIRAGDLLEVRARAGLPYAGKMNVNEQHNNDRDPVTGLLGNAHDFEFVILQRGYGLPAPAAITLSDLLEEVGGGFQFIWDPTRQTGGERYQSTRVLLKRVRIDSPTNWGPNAELELIDQTGRRLTLQLGRNPSFGDVPAPTATLNVVGILNQESASGQGGYYLLALHVDDVVCGDANCDGRLNFADINPFVLAVSNPALYAARYPDCVPDLTGDFVVDFADINPFVAVLSTGICP
jgi:hypothetical protein